MSPLTSPQYAARSALLLQSTGLTKSLFRGKSGGLMHPCKHTKIMLETLKQVIQKAQESTARTRVTPVTWPLD